MSHLRCQKMMRESQIVNINGTGKDGEITKQDVIQVQKRPWVLVLVKENLQEKN